MSELRIDISTGKGTLSVRSEGLFFGSVRVFPLRKAESVLAETLRAIRTVLEVEDPHRGVEAGAGVADPFPQSAASPPAYTFRASDCECLLTGACTCGLVKEPRRCPCSEYRHGVPCRRCR